MPIGNQRSRTEKAANSSAAVTKLGRLMPIRATERLSQSNAPPRFTDAMTPMATPPKVATVSATSPSVTDTGSAGAIRLFTDHSSYVRLWPKSPLSS